MNNTKRDLYWDEDRALDEITINAQAVMSAKALGYDLTPDNEETEKRLWSLEAPNGRICANGTLTHCLDEAVATWKKDWDL